MSAISAHCVRVCVCAHQHSLRVRWCRKSETLKAETHANGNPSKLKQWGFYVRFTGTLAVAGDLDGWRQAFRYAFERYTKRMLLDVECNEWLNMPGGIGLPHRPNRSSLMLYVFVLSRPTGRSSTHFVTMLHTLMGDIWCRHHQQRGQPITSYTH